MKTHERAEPSVAEHRRWRRSSSIATIIIESVRMIGEPAFRIAVGETCGCAVAV
jgi:hypothetical protein